MGDLTIGATWKYLPAVFEHCEDAKTTKAITDDWVSEVHPDGTDRLIADISAAVAGTTVHLANLAATTDPHTRNL